jgi:predicted MFS family arabinose efflux permease
MSQYYEEPIGAASDARPRKGVGIIVLLVILSLANTFVLIIGIGAWADAVSHGDDDSVGPIAVATIMTAIALAGIGGAWFTRKWGPRLYLVVSATSLVLGLIIFPGSFSLLGLVGVGLAVGLWLNAEANWD